MSRLWIGLCRIQETKCSLAGSKCEGWESHRNPFRHGPCQRGELQPGKVGGFSSWTATVTHGELGGEGGIGSSWDKGQVRKGIGCVCSIPHKCLPLSPYLSSCVSSSKLSSNTLSAIRAPPIHFPGTLSSFLLPQPTALHQIFVSLCFLGCLPHSRNSMVGGRVSCHFHPQSTGPSGWPA